MTWGVFLLSPHSQLLHAIYVKTVVVREDSWVNLSNRHHIGLDLIGWLLRSDFVIYREVGVYLSSLYFVWERRGKKQGTTMFDSVLRHFPYPSWTLEGFEKLQQLIWAEKYLLELSKFH